MEGAWKDGFGQLPNGYAVFVIEVFRVATKYEDELLAEAVSNLLDWRNAPRQRQLELRRYLSCPLEIVRALVAIRPIRRTILSENLRYQLYDLAKEQRIFSNVGIRDDDEDEDNPEPDPDMDQFEIEAEAFVRRYPRLTLEVMGHYEGGV